MCSWISVVSWIAFLKLTIPWPPSFLLLSIQSRGVEFRLKPSMHGKELSYLDVSGFYLLFWQVYYPSTVPDDWQGIDADRPDLLPPIQPTPQDLHDSLQLFSGWSFSSWLFFVLECYLLVAQPPQFLVPLHLFVTFTTYITQCCCCRSL